LKAKGNSPAHVALKALEQIEIEEYEIITMYYGESITPDEAQQLAEEIESHYPDHEVEVVDGGQPHYHYILSAE
jgi:dihydroxyacetone kinase-like predicted kinase